MAATPTELKTKEINAAPAAKEISEASNVKTKQNPAEKPSELSPQAPEQTYAKNSIQSEATTGTAQINTNETTEELEPLALSADAQFVEEELPPDFWGDSKSIVTASEKVVPTFASSPPGQQAEQEPDNGRYEEELEPRQESPEPSNKLTIEAFNTKQVASFEDLDEASEAPKLASDERIFAQLQTLFPGQILDIEELENEDAEDPAELPLELEVDIEA